PAWAKRVGLRPREIKAAVSYDHYFLAIAAACGGLGHLVVPKLLVAQHLEDGVLATMGTPAVEGDGRYWAFLGPRTRAPASATEFCRWLKGLVALSRSRNIAAAPSAPARNRSRHRVP